MNTVDLSMILASILEEDYGYYLIAVTDDYVIVDQTMTYMIDVKEDVDEIMHLYPDLRDVRLRVSQDSQGIMIELI